MSRIIPFLSIEKIVLHGYGLGYAEGKAVFVPYTMPGDCVDVKVLLEKKDIIFGSVAEYKEIPKTSILPACDAFGGENACGGCDWLMAPYDLQLEWKTELVRQTFTPLRLKTKVKPCLASPLSTHYRNKSFLPAGKNKNGLYFGMYERYSHNVVPHKSCLLQPEVMDHILNEITTFAQKVKLEPYDEVTHKGILRHAGIRINQNGNEVLLILVTKGSKFPFTNQLVRRLTERFPSIVGIVQNINRSSGNVILGDEEKLLYGRPYLQEELLGKRFRLHYKSFLQINPDTAESMYAFLKEQVDAGETVLDAFCGIGSIGLCLADKVKAVHGIEECPEAVADAEYNSKLNKTDKAVFHCGKVEAILPNLVQEIRFTTAILDPPRKGVEPAALQAITDSGIPRILYVSCNPSTLERDVRFLLEQGYKVQSIQPFDMFPQTWHIETVVQLNRT
jgi:23S rRNA (uracil1939-C5)-methyltransferase